MKVDDEMKQCLKEIVDENCLPTLAKSTGNSEEDSQQSLSYTTGLLLKLLTVC